VSDPSADPRQTLGEEIANSVTHGVALVASLAGLPVLLMFGAARRSPWSLVGACVFAATMVLLYASSTLYHALPESRAKRVFHVFDHAAIYLLIAGTYTPFTLGVLRGLWGWILFGTVWAIAAFGIAYKALAGTHRFPHLSTVLYVGMGWLIVVAIRPLVTRVAAPGIWLLVAGGLLYTGGVAFYAARRRYAHAVWHLFVIGGNTCHFLAVLWYAG
jgi:hemolysin III